jgi:hypothetical protein
MNNFLRLLRSAVPSVLLPLAMPAEANHFDFRTQPDADARYSIAICARPSPDSASGIPPHAFAVWREVNDGGERVSMAVGYAPNDGLKALIGSSTNGSPVASQSSQGASAGGVRSCIELLVNKREFATAANVARAPFKRVGTAQAEAEPTAVYSVAQEDASTSIAEVATRFSNRGLYVPGRRAGELPLAYVRRLIDANASR